MGDLCCTVVDAPKGMASAARDQQERQPLKLTINWRSWESRLHAVRGGFLCYKTYDCPHNELLLTEHNVSRSIIACLNEDIARRGVFLKDHDGIVVLSRTYH